MKKEARKEEDGRNEKQKRENACVKGTERCKCEPPRPSCLPACHDAKLKK